MTDISILKVTSAMENHEAEKTLDFKPHTFWYAMSRVEAEIRFEFRYAEALSDIWIQTGTFQLTPQRVTVQVLSDKVLKKYTVLVDDVDLDDRGNQSIFVCSVSSYSILRIIISHSPYHDISYSVSSYPILSIIISHTS